MIHFTALKGIIMSSVIIVCMLAIAYLIIMKMVQSDSVSFEHNHIPQRIKDEINEQLGSLICVYASLDAIGFLYDDFNSDDIHRPGLTYLVQIKARIGKSEKCMSVLIEDLSDNSIKMGIKDLIKKIQNAKDDLRITC